MKFHRAVAPARWLLVSTFIGGISLGYALGSTPGRQQILLIALAAYVAVGWIVSGRRSGNPIGWIFLLVGFFTGISALSDGLMTLAVDASPPVPWYGALGAWVTSWFWFPLFACATLFTVLLFPSGLPSSRWRPVLWVSIFATAGTVGLTSMTATLPVGTTADKNLLEVCPDGTIPYPGESGCAQAWVTNPLGIPAPPGSLTHSIGVATIVVLITLLTACYVLAVVGAVIRVRRATGVERLQMRWFAFAASVLLAWVFVSSLVVKGDPVWSEVVFAGVVALIPLSCGIAIMRYRLYDIDRVISRTASYAIVTGLLLAIYGAIVISASQLLHTTSSVIVAAATLAAAASARPVLRRVQTAVDRRFNRAQYDAHITVEEFGRRLRDDLDSEQVLNDLLAVIGETMQPSLQTIWMAQPVSER
jgi:hypothetical protein